MTLKRRFRTSRQTARGIALIEAMVGILIFCFGILALAGLQVAMARAQGSAKFRAEAIYLSNEILSAVVSDRPHLDQYNASTCAGHDRCKDWLAKVQTTLPQGAAAISASGSGEVSVTLTWSTTAEGTHSYVLATTVGY